MRPRRAWHLCDAATVQGSANASRPRSSRAALVLACAYLHPHRAGCIDDLPHPLVDGLHAKVAGRGLHSWAGQGAGRRGAAQHSEIATQCYPWSCSCGCTLNLQALPLVATSPTRSSTYPWIITPARHTWRCSANGAVVGAGQAFCTSATRTTRGARSCSGAASKRYACKS